MIEDLQILKSSYKSNNVLLRNIENEVSDVRKCLEFESKKVDEVESFLKTLGKQASLLTEQVRFCWASPRLAINKFTIITIVCFCVYKVPKV